MVPVLAIEDLSTTTIFMMIFGLVRRRAAPSGRADRRRGVVARGRVARARVGTTGSERARRRAVRGAPQVLLSFGGGALAAYIYDEDRKKDK